MIPCVYFVSNLKAHLLPVLLEHGNNIYSRWSTRRAAVETTRVQPYLDETHGYTPDTMSRNTHVKTAPISLPCLPHVSLVNPAPDTPRTLHPTSPEACTRYPTYLSVAKISHTCVQAQREELEGSESEEEAEC